MYSIIARSPLFHHKKCVSASGNWQLLQCWYAADSACQHSVTQLTDVVAKYAECSSQNVLNSSMCEQCVDFYLVAADHIDTNFAVCLVCTLRLIQAPRFADFPKLESVTIG